MHKDAWCEIAPYYARLGSNAPKDSWNVGEARFLVWPISIAVKNLAKGFQFMVDDSKPTKRSPMGQGKRSLALTYG